MSLQEFTKKRPPGRPPIPNKRSVPDQQVALASLTAIAAADLIAQAARPMNALPAPSSPPSGSQQAMSWDITVEGSNFSPNTRTGKSSSSWRGAANAFSGNIPNTMMEAIHPDVVTGHSVWVSLARHTPPEMSALLCSPAVQQGLSSHQIATMPFEHRAAIAQLARQRTPLWFALRQGVVTGSNLGEILGLGFGGDTLLRAYQQAMPNVQHPSQRVQPADQLSELRMAWGRNHESNGVKFLIEQAGAIHGLNTHRGSIIQVCERGLHFIIPSSLPAAVQQGLDLSQLPIMGSSPDVELRWVLGNVCVARVAGEIKAPFPFKLYGGPREGLYGFDPDVVGNSVTPVQYVQCQAHLLALPGVTTCLLVSHGVEKVKVFTVHLNEAWCNLMLKQLQQINMKYLKPQLFPPAKFWKGLDGYSAFEVATTQACSNLSAQELSSCKGGDGRKFLD